MQQKEEYWLVTRIDGKKDLFIKNVFFFFSILSKK